MAGVVRINLLPHREEKRQARQRQFVSFAVLLAILGLAVVGLVHMIFAAKIDDQLARNKLLRTEIAKLDDQIREIDKLRDQIQQVLARKQVVETLQANRSEAVHLLDQIVLAGGCAQLPGLDELVEIKLVSLPGAARGAAAQQVNEFTLNFQVKRLQPSSTVGPAPASARPANPGAKA
jgi:Tfp pilus assembly protein PilN